MACAAVVSFPNARGDRASEWANERAWNEKKNILLPSSPLYRGAVGGDGNLRLLSQTIPAYLL